MKLKQWDAAAILLRDCLEIREKNLPDSWLTFNTKSVLGECLMGQKKYPDAEKLMLPAYEGLTQREAKIPAEFKPRLREALQRIVQLYDAWDKKDEAAKWRKKLDS